MADDDDGQDGQEDAEAGHVALVRQGREVGRDIDGQHGHEHTANEQEDNVAELQQQACDVHCAGAEGAKAEEDGQ